MGSFREDSRGYAESVRKGGFSLWTIPTTKLKYKEGDELALNFIPFKTKKGVYKTELQIDVHWNLGSDGRTAVICPSIENKPCPICEYYSKNYSEDCSDREKKYLAGIRAKRRVLCNVVDINTNPNKLLCLDASFYCTMKRVWEETQRKRTKRKHDDAEYFADPDKGYTVSCEICPDIKLVKVMVFDSIEFEERGAYPQSLLDKAVNFEDCYELKSYAELVAILNGEEYCQDDVVEEEPTTKDAEEEDDENEEETHKIKRSKKGKKKKVKRAVIVENDDEEEDDDEEDDDDDLPF